MANIIGRLRAAGARIDGVQTKADGSIAFVATNGGGAWTDDQKQAVMVALGLVKQVLTPAQLQAAFAAAIQQWLDATAKAFGYDNINTAVSYANSTKDLWQRQALALIAWRDNVWAAAIDLLAQVEAGTTEIPTSDEAVIALMPQPEIPES